MTDLYPLKFENILKEKVWGGNSLAANYNKQFSGKGLLGESWEISAVSGNLSVVSNGFLEGNNIEELIEVYMGDLTGDIIYEKYGNEFPLLIKFIETKEKLSVQVHPGDELAKKRHHAFGKTEMWYILESQKNSRIYTGFKKGVTKETYLQLLQAGEIGSVLNAELSEPGDVFFTPAGRVHAIGEGIVLVEIQQTSDITYRIYDWDRTGEARRELHTDLALDAIDFTASDNSKIKKTPELNRTINLVNCEFFNTNVLEFDRAIFKEFYMIDSFVIYICTRGEFNIAWENEHIQVKKGETVLIPAMIKEFTLEPVIESCVLEVYIKNKIEE